MLVYSERTDECEFCFHLIPNLLCNFLLHIELNAPVPYNPLAARKVDCSLDVFINNAACGKRSQFIDDWKQNL